MTVLERRNRLKGFFILFYIFPQNISVSNILEHWKQIVSGIKNNFTFYEEIS